MSCCAIKGEGGSITVFFDETDSKQYRFKKGKVWEVIFMGFPSLVAFSSLKQYGFKNIFESINICFMHELSHWADDYKCKNDKEHCYVWNDFLRLNIIIK